MNAAMALGMFAGSFYGRFAVATRSSVDYDKLLDSGIREKEDIDEGEVAVGNATSHGPGRRTGIEGLAGKIENMMFGGYEDVDQGEDTSYGYDENFNVIKVGNATSSGQAPDDDDDADLAI